jgi:hypothetical protein
VLEDVVEHNEVKDAHGKIELTKVAEPHHTPACDTRPLSGLGIPFHTLDFPPKLRQSNR